MTWTDDKMDALAGKVSAFDKKVDAGFAALEKKIAVEAVRSEERYKTVVERFDGVDSRFDRLEDRFDSFQRTFTQILGGLIGTMVLALITMLVAILS